MIRLCEVVTVVMMILIWEINCTAPRSVLSVTALMERTGRKRALSRARSVLATALRL